MMRKILFAFAVVLLALPNLHALTLYQMRTELRRNLRDASSSSSDQRYSDATLNDYLNEAQREIVNNTWLSQKTTEYALTPRTTYYNLPADCINVQDVRYRRGASVLDLDEISLPALRNNNVTWDSFNGTPIEYLITQSTFSSASSSSSLKISYIPIISTTGATVSVWYYNLVDDLNSDSDVPFNGKRHLYPYHMVLVYHASMRIKAIEGRVDESGLYSQLYTNALKTIQDRIGRLPNYTPSIGGK